MNRRTIPVAGMVFKRRGLGKSRIVSTINPGSGRVILHRGFYFSTQWIVQGPRQPADAGFSLPKGDISRNRRMMGGSS